MTINPRDYDLDELRKMARERGDTPSGQSTSDDTESTRSEMSEVGESSEMGGGFEPLDSTRDRDRDRERFESGLYRELMPLEAGADGLEKPYLTGLPETYAAEFLVFEWLEFLLENFGYQGTTEALSYYESVGWITEDVKNTLADYLLGIEQPTSDVADGDVDDHKLSLVYVAKLVSMR